MAGGAAAAAAAAIAQAIKASGAIVSVQPAEFRKLLRHNPEGVVVHAVGGFFSPSHKYLMSYRGFAIYTSAGDPISLPASCQVIEAEKIWVPN